MRMTMTESRASQRWAQPSFSSLEWKSPTDLGLERGVLSDGVGGLLLGHKSGPVPSRSPVGRGAQIDLLIDQQLGEEAAAGGPMGGTGPLGVTDNDRLCHKMLVV